MVNITALRAFFLKGEIVWPGATVQASPVDATSAVGSGRAKFATDEDRDAAKAGVLAADAKACPNVNEIRSAFWSRKET
jgi:hypothetical protein